MDLSKLPRMSQTPPPPREASYGEESDRSAGPRHAHPEPFPYATTEMRPAPGAGPAVWLSFVLGLVFVLMGLRFARWAVVTVTGGIFETGVNWTAGPQAGQPVAYFDLIGGVAWTEAALFLFGLALLLEGLALLAITRAGSGIRKAVLMLALVVAGTATLLNLGLTIYLVGQGVTPFMSLLMVAFGGYLFFQLMQIMAEERAIRAIHRTT